MRKLLLPLLAICLLFAACNPQKRLARQEKTYLKKTYKVLKGTLNEAEVLLLEDTVKVLFPEHLLFALNSSELTPDVRPLMKKFADALNRFHNTNILINGHTDNTGSKAYNLQISKKRAEAAKAVLVSDEVANSRMMTWGFGMESPITNNNSEGGRRRNRRVEFIILYNIAQPEK